MGQYVLIAIVCGCALIGQISAGPLLCSRCCGFGSEPAIILVLVNRRGSCRHLLSLAMCQALGQETLVTNSRHHVHFGCYFRSVDEQVEVQGWWETSMQSQSS